MAYLTLTLTAAAMGFAMVAAFLTLRLAPLTGQRAAWTLIAAALAIMALREGLCLDPAASDASWAAKDWTVQILSLATPILMLAAIVRVRSFFEGFQDLLESFGATETTAASSRNIHDRIEERIGARARELERAIRRLHREIEERKSAEERLRASEHRYRTLVENISDTVYIADDQGRFTFASPQAEALTGYTREQLLRMHYRDLVDAEYLPLVEERFARVMQGGTLEPEELVIRRADGHRIPIETYTSLLPPEAEGCSPAIQGMVRDISKRKAAEAERTLLATAVRQSSDGIVIMDATGNILYANPSFEHMSGFGQSELIGRSFHMVQGDAQSESRFEEAWAALERGEAWKGRVLHKGKGGKHFLVQATFYPIRDRGGAVTHLVAVEQDVTREVQLEQALLQAQKVEVIGTLASGMAHDFNNMLSIAIGQAELMADALPPEDASLRNLDLVLQACYHAKDLLRQLLALGRTEAVDRIPVSLPALVQDLMSLLQPTLPPDVRIETVMPQDPEAFTISADPTQVQQVLMNLCTNALDAMQATGGTLRVSLDLESIPPGTPGPHPTLRPGSYVKLTVSDTGCGIDWSDPETREKIFDPFFTTKPAGQGTGLGLAVVRAIVVNHGGAVTVESEPGVGTRFSVYFPRESPP